MYVIQSLKLISMFYILNKKEWKCNQCGYIIKKVMIGGGWREAPATPVCCCCGSERKQEEKEHAVLKATYPDLNELINKFIIANLRLFLILCLFI